jgi:uncharacterized membrane protein YhaH (DUF805 family)
MNEIINYYVKALKNYANFNGRATRSEFWYFVLVNFIISLILTIIDNAIFNTSVLSLIYSLGVLLPSLAIGARRLHDINKSGWWQLIALIPIVGPIILIIWWATPSKKESNY